MMSSTYLKSRIAKIVSENAVKTEVNPRNKSAMDSFQDSIAHKNMDDIVDLEKIKSIVYNDISTVAPKDQLLFLGKADKYLWGIKPTESKTEKILKNMSNNEKMYILEDTFIRSISTTATVLKDFNDVDPMYFSSCGYTVDDLSHYVDATRPSRMELTINSDWEMSEEQKQRVDSLIKKIIDNKITKYNNQPICEPKIGRDGVEKILVIDQSYNDYSIIKGMANDKTFENMLEAAIKENPNADIIIKTHPDAIGDLSTKKKCYYQDIESKNNVYKITDMINPISLIEYADKVYVCSSQFGFEALMCGKETHIFGMPFYAGWGLTIDAQKLDRRTKQRTLEEVFYISYIMFSMYLNPKTNKPCEIEEAIDFLIESRVEYFKEMSNA